MTENTPDAVRFIFTYRNWRGEVSERRVAPLKLWFGRTAWHPEPQWFLMARDLEKDVVRDFAMRDIGARAMQAAMPAPAGVRVEALMEFARGRIREAWEGCEDGDEIQDHARRLGLIMEAPGGYDPKKHGTQGEAEPGEPWFVFADWLKTDAIEDAGAREGFSVEDQLPRDPVFGLPYVPDATPIPAGAGDLVERARIVAFCLRSDEQCGEGPEFFDDLASRIEALEAEVARYKRLLDLEAADHDAASTRATTAEADLAALRAEVARLRVIVGRFYQANDDGKLCDDIDNDGVHYMSQFLADTLDMASAALAPAKGG